jgi:hypothetical protein
VFLIGDRIDNMCRQPEPLSERPQAKLGRISITVYKPFQTEDKEILQFASLLLQPFFFRLGLADTLKNY